MAIQPDSGFVRADTNRKVWVLNRDSETYEETFRGDHLVVPPDEKKELLMPYLKAERFLSQPAPIADAGPDGKPRPGMPRGKQLYIQELSSSEKKKLDPRYAQADEESEEQYEMEVAAQSTRMAKNTGKAVPAKER